MMRSLVYLGAAAFVTACGGGSQVTQASPPPDQGILCSVMAIDTSVLMNKYGVPETLTQPEMDAFNQQQIALAQHNGYLYADYCDAMLTPAGVADDSLLLDGIHPNAGGYAIMWKVIVPLIAEDLR